MTTTSKQIYMNPILNKREVADIEALTKRYERFKKTSLLTNVGNKINESIPDKIKKMSSGLLSEIGSTDQFALIMNWVNEGFNVVQEQASKYSINESEIIKNLRNIDGKSELNDINDICTLRSYKIAKAVNRYKSNDLLAAIVEGGSTGAMGFAGIPFNVVLSTFLFFRSVQSIAMYYGYDIKNEESELIVASEVFMNALIPNNNRTSEIGSMITKVLLFTQVSVVKQASSKTWSEMIAKGGVTLLLTQIRSLSNKAAQKALENAGAKSLENSLFREIFEQLGKKLSLKTIGLSAPLIGGLFGALIDTAQMNRVLEFADIFYQKRFILEKEMRIQKRNEF